MHDQSDCAWSRSNNYYETNGSGPKFGPEQTGCVGPINFHIGWLVRSIASNTYSNRQKL
jgi:hypothetical protein